ncbi:PP2C-domain-containing protein [Meira miltonrushii]|uniref:PP2C-domain-containing protein n=1 Tax=Meira miltonrushii TaxID=1280837 RepID=A0A316VD68_9BASI|nr:PP2C-domain-containing protein [Meira miltonrushii]PWN35599.1 PP2C-domain-containing protein [Meira miltonrushii]
MVGLRGMEDVDSSEVNASSESQTTASGSNTHGTVNQHPGSSRPAKAETSGLSTALAGPDGKVPFRVGIAEDRNKRWRRTMEDAHAFVYDFGSVHGQGYFGVFDGHAGKHSAEWCGQHFHEYLLDTLVNHSNQSVPDIFNKTYHSVDQQLSQLADQLGSSSGCTAVTVLLRLEDEDGKPAAHAETGGVDKTSRKDSSKSKDASSKIEGVSANVSKDGLVEVSGEKIRRVLYTANVGDARAVLCRGGKAVRLTYDHKGSDAQEAKRIMDAGGFVMNNRVNGVLAVTRSLGDAAMKDFVVGAPYTTETTLSDQDSFLIVACDGLWDVADDQDAVDLIRDEEDPQVAAARLLQHALSNFSTDNTSVMVVRFACNAEAAKNTQPGFSANVAGGTGPEGDLKEKES